MNETNVVYFDQHGRKRLKTLDSLVENITNQLLFCDEAHTKF